MRDYGLTWDVSPPVDDCDKGCGFPTCGQLNLSLAGHSKNLVTGSLKNEQICFRLQEILEGKHMDGYLINRNISNLKWQKTVSALAGNRTRINCLEGSYAHHYTTSAWWVGQGEQNPLVFVWCYGAKIHKEWIGWPQQGVCSKAINLDWMNMHYSTHRLKFITFQECKF